MLTYFDANKLLILSTDAPIYDVGRKYAQPSPRLLDTVGIQSH